MLITLNLINRSTDTNPNSVVIFGDSAGVEAAAPAKVIENLNTDPGETFTVSGDTLRVGLRPPAQHQGIRTALGDDAEQTFSLAGIASADLVLNGGGGVPYTFSLQNVERA